MRHALESVPERQISARIVVIAGLLAAEFALIALAYTYNFGGNFGPVNQAFCPLFGEGQWICGRLGLILKSSVGFTPVALLILMMTSGGRRIVYPVLQVIVNRSGRPAWLALNLLGLLLVISPVVAIMMRGGGGLGLVWLVVLGVGAVLLVAGTALWRAPASAWRNAIGWPFVLGLSAMGVLLPYLASIIEMRVLSADVLQQSTLSGAAWMLQILGYEPITDPRNAYLGIRNFAVTVGYSCSGMFGIVLACGTILGFGLLMRDQLRLDRILLILPIVGLMSWCFNIVRIVVLLMIGAHVSPELAVEGFHNYAGWISFMAIAGLMIFVLDRWQWMQIGSDRQAASLRFAEDPEAAKLLPFLLWLGSSLAIVAIYAEPAFGYYWKVLIAGGALLFMARGLPAIRLSPDPVSLILGIGIASAWIPIMAATIPQQSFSSLWPNNAGSTAIIWLFVRIFGTTLVVPIVEELFFRGYLQEKLEALPIKHSAIIAAVLVSTLFAALHQNFLLAFLAGLVLTYVSLRRGRIWDAIFCHATANFVIGGYAVLTDNLALI